MNSSSNALKFAQAFSFFATLPASIYSLIYSLENIENWRPHGTTAFNMILLGIGVPCYLFIHNIKTGKFALKYLLLLGSLWLTNHWSFKVNQLIRKIILKVMSLKLNKPQLSSFLYQILRKMTL